jgi:elongation factor P
MCGLKTSARRLRRASHSIRPAAHAAGLPQEYPMASYGMNDVKTGQKILVNNEPCVITETEYVKPGKGQAFTRIKYRFIKSGRVVEMTMKATDDVEAADVVDTDMQFLYADGEYWHFMQQETFEQVQADKAGVGEAYKYLKGEEACVVTLWNGVPIQVTPPNFVELKIVETDPGVRGDTSGGGGKPATLETGAVVRVPLFVNQDEIIKVNTRTGEYESRVK